MIECEFLANEIGSLLIIDLVKSLFGIEALSNVRIEQLDLVNII
jgi:hypothetical protein